MFNNLTSKQKTIVYVVGGIVILTAGIFAVRYVNKSLLVHRDEAIFSSGNEAIDAITKHGATAYPLADGSFAYASPDKLYVFYTNNRVAKKDSTGKTLKMGSFDTKRIKWDDGSETSFDLIFTR